jgi:small subunit ribosomal protein S6
MHRYETIYILRPDLPDEEVEGLCQRFTKIITDRGGRVIQEDRWGSRSMAYVVKKLRKGYYVFLDYVSDRDTVFELERNFKMVENVIRFMTVLKSSIVDLEALEKEERRSSKPSDIEESESEETSGSGKRKAGSEEGEDEEDSDVEETYEDETPESTAEEA